MKSDDNSRDIILFAGKGGVGKTTCAAVTALHLSLLGKKTVIISTDPTPSLAHIFDIAKYDGLTKISELLFIDEIGVSRVRKMWDNKFGQEVYQVFSSFVEIDYQEFVDFMTSILPGLRDEFMVDYSRMLYETGDFEAIVWDTAPLGQTLALLGMPTMLKLHLKLAPRIYSRLKTGTGTRKSVLDILKGWEILSVKDSNFLKQKVGFNVVTIPEALAFEQLDYIFDEFKKYELNISRLIINNVIAETDSKFLLSKANQQKKYIDFIYKKYSNLDIVRLPMHPVEIRGIDQLKAFKNELYK